MSTPRSLLQEIEAEEARGARTYEDLSDDLRRRLGELGYAPPEIVARGLEALKIFLGAF